MKLPVNTVSLRKGDALCLEEIHIDRVLDSFPLPFPDFIYERIRRLKNTWKLSPA